MCPLIHPETLLHCSMSVITGNYLNQRQSIVKLSILSIQFSNFSCWTTVKVRKIIVILLGEKMCSRVVKCSKNANQIAVSHPFDTCDDSQLLKSLPSMHANVSVPTTTAGWVEKRKNTCIICSLLPMRFHFRDKPLWPTLSRNIASLKYRDIPVTSEATLDEFPYMYTNAGICWLCACVMLTSVQPLSTDSAAQTRLWTAQQPDRRWR